MRRAATLVAGVALLAGCGGGTKTVTVPAASNTQTTQTAQAAAGTPDAGRPGFDPEAIYKNEGAGVVTLIAIQGQGEALGSGFVVDGSGDIATNAHVVTTDTGAKAKQVYAEFGDGNRLTARIVGTDLFSDIALVKVDPSQLQGPGAKLVPLPLGATSGLQVGDPVAAIGSPFGKEQSLSVGVVSALDREIQSLTSFSISNAIQTDAAINHGNSGGPLLDANGKVIGINSQISSTSGGGEGVGFAVPVETVKRSIDQLRTKGTVDYAFLGIRSVSLYPQLAQRLGLKQLYGALVAGVQSGSPAAKAGLRGARSRVSFEGIDDIPVGGDLIIGVDGRKVTSAEDVTDLIGMREPGQTVSLEIVRDGKQLTVPVKLAKRPEQQAGAR